MVLFGAWDLLTYDLTTFKKTSQSPAVAAFYRGLSDLCAPLSFYGNPQPAGSGNFCG
jgi:hypothetical protein